MMLGQWIRTRIRTMRERADGRRIFTRGILILVCLLAVVRFSGYVHVFGSDVLQMDFSPLYTAGTALNAGLSPYNNNLRHDPPIWDGDSTFTHSKYIYPPITAYLFRPLARLPYAAAKYIWIVVLILSSAGALYLAARMAGVPRTFETVLGGGIVLFLFFPFLTALERGQIDAVTLVCVLGGCLALERGRHGNAAVLFACATFLKLYCVYLVPFLLLRRKWRAVCLYAGVVIGMLLVSYAVAPQLNGAYWSKHLPRISQYGEEGTRQMRIDPRLLILYFNYMHVPEGKTVMDGKYYDRTGLTFYTNASLVRTLRATAWGARWYAFLDRQGWGKHKDTLLALLILGVFWGGLFLSEVFLLKGRPFSPLDGAMYWQTVILVVLIAGVRTWTMNVVWALPVSVIVYAHIPQARTAAQALLLLGALTGFVLIALPDTVFLGVVPSGTALLLFKYVGSAVLIIGAFLGLLGLHARTNNS